MKTLVVSDIHLCRSFDSKKLDFLYSLFSMYDHIILNGDFWSYYSFDFKSFLDSKWSELFPVLKKKEVVYLYGNHDRKRWTLDGCRNFSSKQSLNYIFKAGGKKYIIEHGDLALNKLCFNNILVVKFSRMMKRVLSDKSYVNTINLFNEKVPKLLNTRLKKYLLTTIPSLEKDTYCVFGHTHYPEIDHNLGFINTGCINNKNAYFLEINDEGFELFSFDYR